MCDNAALFLAVGGSQDDRGGSYGEKGAIFYDASFFVAKNLVVNKCSRVARAISKYVLQLSFLVAANVDDAVVHIHAWVNSFYRAVDAAVFHVSSDDVVAHMQRDDLLVCKNILDDYDGAYAVLVGILVQNFFLTCFAKLGNTHSNAKLFVAIRTHKYETLPSLVFLLVESDVVVTFWTADSFHDFLVNNVVKLISKKFLQMELYYLLVGKLVCNLGYPSVCEYLVAT